MTCSYHLIMVESLLVLLDLSAAFDTIDHNILLNRLENSVSISGSALAWFKSYLSDCHQFVAVNEEVSYRSQVLYGVPQGSVLGPLLFTLYMLPLGNIIRKHGVSIHCYADDAQLYMSSPPGETHQIEKLMECIVDIKDWMTNNFLVEYTCMRRCLEFESNFAYQHTKNTCIYTYKHSHIHINFHAYTLMNTRTYI